MTVPVVAVAALPRLPSEVLRARRGMARGTADPVEDIRGVVLDETDAVGTFAVRSVSVLVDATDAARTRGVVPGMRVLDAQLYAPTIQLDIVHREALLSELAVVAEVLLSLSPSVEPLWPEGAGGLPMAAVALDLSGMVRPTSRILLDIQRACARLGHEATVVSSPGNGLSMALARDLARRAPGICREVKPSDVPAVLTTLSLDALALPPQLALSLHALGARTAADVARLLPHGGVERLGAFARPLVDVLEARCAPLRGVQPPERVMEQRELEHPLSEVEPLVFVLSSLCGRLCLRVRARRGRIAEVGLTLARRHGEPSTVSVAFPHPIVDDKAMLRALQVRLERFTLGGPVDSVVLEATRVSRHGPRQLALKPGAREEVMAEEALHAFLAELSTELGRGRVGCMTLTDEPLPERMTRLTWPVPPPSGTAVPAARPASRHSRRPAPLAPMTTAGGRFLAGWPWPLRVLDVPLRLDKELPVTERELLGVLEGEDRTNSRYERAYAVLTFVDGRRALAIVDDENDEVWLQGWFD